MSVMADEEAVVTMLPPRVMRFPESVNALVSPADPSLVRLMPPMMESAVRLLTALLRVLPVKVMTLVKVGSASLSQLAAVFQLSSTPVPSQICPAEADEMVRRVKNALSLNVVFMMMRGLSDKS